MSIDPRIVDLLNDFADSQPALRLPNEPYEKSNPMLGDLIDYISNLTTKSTNKYYVDGFLGSDSDGDGSATKPYATIQKALDIIGQPVNKADYMRHIEIHIADTNSSNAGTSPQTWNGVYEENLIVPCRSITIYGKGVKIGDNSGSGFGNILKEYSSSRRFGVPSADFRPALTLIGGMNVRDSHNRLRNGIHIGGTCRTAILKRNFDNIYGDGVNTITVHIASGQNPYQITIPSTYPTDPHIRISVSGTTNYNGIYDITSKVNETTFIATRVSGTNSATSIETSGSFYESDSAGASGLTHDTAFLNCYMHGQYTCDDGTVNGAATTAGTEVFYAVNSRFHTGIEGRTILLQRNENNTYTGDCIVNSIAGMFNCSFSGNWTVNTFTYSSDDTGLMSCKWTAAKTWTISNASQTVRMDSTSYSSFVRQGCTWVTNTPYIDLLHRPTVAQANRTAQAATINTTTLFTPAADGIYRINVYASCTTAGSGGTATPVIGWRDDTTTQSLSLSAVNLTVQGSYSNQSITVKCKSGQPITYGCTVAGATGSPQYALYVNIEPIT